MAAKRNPPSDDDQAQPMFRTSIVITLDQAEALKSEASRLQRDRVRRGHPAGKADVSEVLRGVLEAWMRDRK